MAGRKPSTLLGEHLRCSWQTPSFVRCSSISTIS